MRYVLSGIERTRDGYVAVVRRLARVAIVGVVVVGGTLAASAWLFSKTPQSFLPDEDQGAIFAALRLPEGVSVNRTEAVVKQVEDIVRPIPGVEGVLSVVGLNFIDYVPSANQAFFVIRLKTLRGPHRDGRIGPANFTMGNLVSPSSGTLATIVSQDPIYVTFQASEADVIEYKQPRLIFACSSKACACKTSACAACALAAR